MILILCNKYILSHACLNFSWSLESAIYTKISERAVSQSVVTGD